MTQQPFDREVLTALPRRHDLDIHVCRVRVDEQVYYDVREYIPSILQYGRGILIPERLVPDVAAALAKGANDDDDA